jgi:hypothetical protein
MLHRRAVADRRIVVGIVASLLLVGSCADDTASSSSAVAEASRTPLGNGVAPASADAVTAALRSRDLAVDRVVELPGSDLPSYVVVVKGEDALASWAAARALVPQTGHYPVIVGGPLEFGGDAVTEFEQTLDSAEYLLDDGLTVESELTAADRINAERWFQSRAEYLGITSHELEAEPPLPEVDWPNDEFTSDREILSGDPLPLVEIALVPTRNGWEAPAYLLWGGWNDARCHMSTWPSFDRGRSGTALRLSP